MVKCYLTVDWEGIDVPTEICISAIKRIRNIWDIGIIHFICTGKAYILFPEDYVTQMKKILQPVILLRFIFMRIVKHFNMYSQILKFIFKEN